MSNLKQPVAPSFRRTPERQAAYEKNKFRAEQTERAVIEAERAVIEAAAHKENERRDWPRKQFGDKEFRTSDYEKFGHHSVRSDLEWLAKNGIIECVQPPDGRADSGVGGRLWRAIHKHGVFS